MQRPTTIKELLERVSLQHLAELFEREEVDFALFLTLDEQDLREIGITSYGNRLKILRAVKDELRSRKLASKPPTVGLTEAPGTTGAISGTCINIMGTSVPSSSLCEGAGTSSLNLPDIRTVSS